MQCDSYSNSSSLTGLESHLAHRGVRLSHGLSRGAAVSKKKPTSATTPARAAECPLKMGMLKQLWFAMGAEIMFSNKGSIPDLERCVMLKID